MKYWELLISIMKYIDAEKLREKIIEQMESLPRETGRGAGTITSKGYGMMQAFQIMRSIIDSLQQEQVVNKELGTLIACDIIEMTVKKAIDKPQDKEKEEKLMTRKINYLRSLEENYIQQEQPEVVDLEKDIQECWQSWVSPSNQDSVDGVFPKTEFAFYARHFYELGLNARKEE